MGNKKKKNKQKKPTEDGAASGTAQTSFQQESNNVSDPSHPIQSSQNVYENKSESNGLSELIEKNDHHGTGSNDSDLEPTENQDWIKEEARLKVMIKELQLEVGSRIQKEAELETKISKLLEEKDVSYQKEAKLEMKLRELQEEKGVSHQKEINYEEKISQLIQDKDTLCMEETKLSEKVELLERAKASLVKEEDSMKQKIAALDDENTRMRVQVMELEECRKQLSLEKQHLMENLSSMRLQIEDLERISASAHSSIENANDASKIDELNSEIEAACQLIERLVTENADLVEKMNELYTELGQWQPKDEDFSISVSDSHHEYESSNGIAISTEYANGSDKVLIEEERLKNNHSNEDHSAVSQKFPGISTSGEIVQISLNGNETRDLEGQALIDDDDDDDDDDDGYVDSVPLSDSPLIGAPYRLISFMANYVSGADLVGENSSSVQ